MNKFGRLLASLILFVGLTLIGIFIYTSLMELLRGIGLSLIVAIIVTTALVPGGMFAAARLMSKRKPDSIVPVSLYVATQWVAIIPLVIVQAQMVPLGPGSFLGLPLAIWFFIPGVLAILAVFTVILLNAIYFRDMWPLALSVILLFAAPVNMIDDGPYRTMEYAGLMYFILPVFSVLMLTVGILRLRSS